MLGINSRKDKNKYDKEYMELKKTIWSLQSIALNLQQTAGEFEHRLVELKELNQKEEAIKNTQKEEATKDDRAR